MQSKVNSQSIMVSGFKDQITIKNWKSEIDHKCRAPFLNNAFVAKHWLILNLFCAIIWNPLRATSDALDFPVHNPSPPPTECRQFRVGMSVATVRLVSRSLSIECCGERDKFEVKYFTSICTVTSPFYSPSFGHISEYFKYSAYFVLFNILCHPWAEAHPGVKSLTESAQIKNWISVV